MPNYSACTELYELVRLRRFYDGSTLATSSEIPTTANSSVNVYGLDVREIHVAIDEIEGRKMMLAGHVIRLLMSATESRDFWKISQLHCRCNAP